MIWASPTDRLRTRLYQGMLTVDSLCIARTANPLVRAVVDWEQTRTEWICNERDKRTPCLGWIRKRPSGRFQASYLGLDRKRHFAPTTFANRMQAERWLANERDLIDRAIASHSEWL